MSEIEHLLICLAEECAEISEQCSRVAVRVSKTLRFGLHEIQPEQLLANTERIAIELADLLALAEVLEARGVISRADVDRKKQKLETFMDMSEQCGTLVRQGAIVAGGRG